MGRHIEDRPYSPSCPGAQFTVLPPNSPTSLHGDAPSLLRPPSTTCMNANIISSFGVV